MCRVTSLHQTYDQRRNERRRAFEKPTMFWGETQRLPQSLQNGRLQDAHTNLKYSKHKHSTCEGTLPENSQSIKRSIVHKLLDTRVYVHDIAGNRDVGTIGVLRGLYPQPWVR